MIADIIDSFLSSHLNDYIAETLCVQPSISAWEESELTCSYKTR